MIIVKIFGGLGNQMFQYAYAKVLNLRGYTVVLDISTFEKNVVHDGYGLSDYDVSIKIADKVEIDKYYKIDFISRVLYKLNLKSKYIVYEHSLCYDEKLLSVEDNSLIEGYFQSEKYFLDIRDVLLKEFTIKKSLSDYAIEVKNKIYQAKSSCSLHIRRGDYVSNSDASKVHGTCDLDYYRKAMSFIDKTCDEVNYFVFSDDIVWVKENLKIPNALYIESLEKRIPHEDIYLMSLCHHNIIANSSFSWWGAWLNENIHKMVIAPKRWFLDEELFKQSDDIVCESWIKI